MACVGIYRIYSANTIDFPPHPPEAHPPHLLITSLLLSLLRHFIHIIHPSSKLSSSDIASTIWDGEETFALLGHLVIPAKFKRGKAQKGGNGDQYSAITKWHLFCSRNPILLFHRCFGTRKSTPFHRATSISPIQNQKYPMP